jgi:hypothetical protein
MVQTCLDEFGDDSFREGLDHLVRALDQEAKLNDNGQLAFTGLIVGLLSQRLQIEDWYRRHPEIDNEQIESPLIGLGLPRTGSTALSALLAEDPNARSLLTWEAVEPCPPPSTVKGPDSRIARAIASADRQRDLQPRRSALVPSSPTGPQECQLLMGLDFKSHLFTAMGNVPSYTNWLLYDADLSSTYRYERRALKLLQWGSPKKPWRLKCPTHLLFLDQLDEVFPDARYVMTHRDPTDVIVSVADLCEEVGRMLTDDVDRRAIGALQVEHWSVGMERTLAFRAAGHDSRFYDIDFRAMQQDPVREVHGLYDWLAEPVIEVFRAGMTEWWHTNAEQRQQNIHPDPAAYGIDLDQVRALFAEYVSRIPAWTNHQVHKEQK